jgi:hypothetical protein
MCFGTEQQEAFIENKVIILIYYCLRIYYLLAYLYVVYLTTFVSCFCMGLKLGLSH